MVVEKATNSCLMGKSKLVDFTVRFIILELINQGGSKSDIFGAVK